VNFTTPPARASPRHSCFGQTGVGNGIIYSASYRAATQTEDSDLSGVIAGRVFEFLVA